MVEVLVTMVILGVGLVALLHLQSYLIGYNDVAKQQSEANILAQEKIESLRNFATLNTTVGYKAYADIQSGSEVVSLDNTSYTVQWTIQDDYSPKQKFVKTIVSWLDRKNVNQTLILSSVISSANPIHQSDLIDLSGAGSIQPP